ncbi:MAG: Gfo/Idh/MocA family oxidoreductase, partial [Bryobacteraceae bacterium]|nr:Gfo/Idh/MocA family oxidoreductase [Bryobacteraceae bacterium]
MNIGVIGLGFMGATHLRALGKVSGAKLAAIASSDEKKLAGDLSGAGGNLGATFDTFDFTGVKKYRRWEELLEDPEVAAVDITLPTALHALAVRKSLEAGKHVLVEKPIALDGDTADELIAMAR